MSDQRAFSSREAARYLGLAPYTLKQSRSTGVLCGSTAPVFRKLGSRTVIYEKATLDTWLDQFQERPNTSAVR